MNEFSQSSINSSYNFEPPKSNTKKIVLIVVIVLVVLCCCCAISTSLLYTFGDQLMSAMGVTY